MPAKGSQEGLRAPLPPRSADPPEEESPLLRFQELTKRYGTATVFDGFSLDVGDGCFVALLGPSGCGKSTLFNVLTGLVPADGGALFWRGRPCPDLTGRAAYMQQRDLLLPWLSLEENVLLPRLAAGSVTDEDRRLAASLLRSVGLGDRSASRPGQVSGGMRQRAALARTVMTGHDLFLLDEPLSALDAVTRLDLQDLLLDVHLSHRKTTVMITHDVEEALRLADEIVLLSAAPMTVVERLVLDEARPRPVEKPRWAALKGRIVASLRREVRR